MHKCEGQGADDCREGNDSRSSMGVRGWFIEIVTRFQSLSLIVTYINVVFFFKNLIVDNKKVPDPQRPHLDKGYNIEEYKKLTMDMVGKVKDLKTVAGSPSIKSITSQLLFRYGITMSWNCQCFGAVLLCFALFAHYTSIYTRSVLN